MNMKTVYAPFALLTLAACGAGGPREPPGSAPAADTGAATLYALPQYESPVRGDRGDILLLAGTGFATGTPGTVVVYQQQQPNMVVPTSIPTMSNATLGAITPLNVDAYGVTVVLPGNINPGQSYFLWVVSPSGSWSNPVLINDARPMWASPGYVYSTVNRPGMERTLKIVGRNLDPAPGHQVQVTFTDPGGNPTTVTATGGGDPSARYATTVTLPSSLPTIVGGPTYYTVSVSRDGVNWVPLPTPLSVLPDPPTGNLGPPSGGTCPAAGASNLFRPACDPCDGQDDTACIMNAIAAAAAYSKGQSGTTGNIRGTVVFGGGACQTPTWIVNPSSSCSSFNTGDVTCDANGITVPPGVNLVADPCLVNAVPDLCSPAANLPILQTGQSFELPQLACNGNAGPLTTPCLGISDCSSQVPGPQACLYVWSDKGKACSSDAECTSGACVNACSDNSQPCSKDADCNPNIQCLPTCAGTCQCQPPSDMQYLFKLMGENLVQGLHIQDGYTATFYNNWSPGALHPYQAPGLAGLFVAGNDVTFTGNCLDGSNEGILPFVALPPAPPLPILPDGFGGYQNVVITGNTFSVFDTAVWGAFEDGVISANLFYPGPYPVTMAGAVGGARRLDISNNVLDGTHRQYSGALGFRAGFFFPSGESHEDVLVSNNTITCVGTRPYNDGEAISLDTNQDVPVFQVGAPVLGASATTVIASWPGTSTVSDPTQLAGRWLRVSSGVGLGQARRITSASATSGVVTLLLSDPFDVVPTTGSTVLVGNQAWQMNIVNNTIDNTCSEQWADFDIANTKFTGGVIELYDSATDSAIDSNTQIDTLGVVIDARYLQTTELDQTEQYFVDVRGNRIMKPFGGLQNGVPNPALQGGAGIALLTSSNIAMMSPSTNIPGFGVSVSYNVLESAAMGLTPQCAKGGYCQCAGIGITPQTASNKPLAPGYLDTLIFANTVGGTPPSFCDALNSSAISNGTNLNWSESTGLVNDPNYPQDTVICDNVSRWANLPPYKDFPPPPPGATSLITCTATSPTCVTIQNGALGTSQDVFITNGPGDGNADSNYSTQVSLTASNASGGLMHEALVRFDLSSIPLGTVVSSAKLTLTTATSDGGPARVRHVTAPWSLSTVTWNNFAYAYDATQVVATLPGVSTGATSVDIAPLVQQWVNQSLPNYGVLLERDPGSTVYLSTRYSTTSSHPALTVCFLPPTYGPPMTSCGSSYADLGSDPASCGTCGHACGGAIPACCGGSCEDLAGPASCGACGNACGGAMPGCCSGSCTDLGSDPLNCGTCGNACGSATPTCSNGVCGGP